MPDQEFKSIASTPQPVPATTTNEQPTFPPHIPQFQKIKHPLRFAISGKKHLVKTLKELISADANVPDHYKAVLHAEIDGLTSEMAEVDLHVVKHANGDVSFQGHIKRIQLG